MQTFLQDIRYALRQLRRSPGFFVTAVLTLALGIGATTAIFTLVYQVILRSIPINHPEQLYKVGKDIDCCNYSGLQGHWSIFSDDLYKYLRDQTPGTEGIAAVQAGSINLSAHRAGDPAGAQPLQVRFVSGNYFSVLGVTPYAGRLLTPQDDREGAPVAAVISDTVWKTKFAGDPHIVGSTVMMTGQPVTIAGITAPNFLGERETADPAGVWIPLAFEPLFEPNRQLMKFPQDHWLDLLVRIPDARQLPAVTAALQGELHQWFHAHPDEFRGVPEKTIAAETTELVSASGGINDLRDHYQSSLKLLMWVAAAVLLIACANLANLMLVRGMGRQQELSVRTALGAPRRRLIRQTLAESLLLSIFGGAAAVFLAYAGSRAIIAMALPGAEVTPLSASPSLPILAFAFAISLLTGVAFGLAPAWITSRANPAEALRGANRSTRDASALPQKLMVILQAALSLALLCTAGLLITSLRHLEHQDFGFQPQGRLFLAIDLQAAGYQANQLTPLYRQFDDKLAHLPGIQNIAYSTYAPMSDNNWGSPVYLPGQDPNAPQNSNSMNAVSRNYFQAVGAHILLGRGFTENDTATSTHVAVVNRAFVDTYLKDKQPVGQHFGADRTAPNEYEIVGVVDNTKYMNPSEPAEPMYLTPISQSTTFTDEERAKTEIFKHYPGNLIVQYRGNQSSITAAVRQTLKAIDPNIPITYMTSYEGQLSSNFTQENLVVRLTTLFGILALVLASLGLYGVTAYAVARRTSEIGVRMALGASRTGILSMVVQRALIQAGIGLCLGLPLAWVGAKLVQSTLYQTSPFQPIVLVSVAALLLLSALAAAFLPARRAASIDPMQALRTE